MRFLVLIYVTFSLGFALASSSQISNNRSNRAQIVSSSNWGKRQAGRACRPSGATTARPGVTAKPNRGKIKFKSTATVFPTKTTKTKARPGATAIRQPLGDEEIVRAQSSSQLHPDVVMPRIANDGQDVPDPGQVASLTSRNNFINYCLTQKGIPATDGQQKRSGSCNSVPMGRILAVDKIPHSKFEFPRNGGRVEAGVPFTIKMAIRNIQTGSFVNPISNYYSAPAHTNENGTLIGHSHVVIQKLKAKNQIEPLDPRKFVFFKGLNQPAVNGTRVGDGNAVVNGTLTAEVSGGLVRGEYRMASINTAANHQPALPAIAQRGSVDDIIYFSVV